MKLSSNQFLLFLKRQISARFQQFFFSRSSSVRGLVQLYDDLTHLTSIVPKFDVNQSRYRSADDKQKYQFVYL